MNFNSHPIKRDVHPDFWKLLEEIQLERIKRGKEELKSKIPLWKLTKTITNLIRSNEHILNELIEVKINA